MPAWWSEPNSGHAYILSLVSIIITLIAAVVGIVGYAVSSFILCFRNIENAGLPLGQVSSHTHEYSVHIH